MYTRRHHLHQWHCAWPSFRIWTRALRILFLSLSNFDALHHVDHLYVQFAGGTVKASLWRLRGTKNARSVTFSRNLHKPCPYLINVAKLQAFFGSWFVDMICHPCKAFMTQYAPLQSSPSLLHVQGDICVSIGRYVLCRRMQENRNNDGFLCQRLQQ